jgi:hypothetical protein
MLDTEYTLHYVDEPKTVPQKGVANSKDAVEKTPFGKKNLLMSWALVMDRHSNDLSVDLKLDNGIELKHVAVRSNQWTGSGSVGYGERDLPPKDCLVLVVFPTGRVEEGLVLCSAFSMFGKHIDKWKSSELVKTGKETEKLSIEESGNKVKEDKTNGNIEIDLQGTIKVTAKNATVEIDTNGNINITANTNKDVIINSGTNGVARKEDAVQSTSTQDAVFWAWLTAAAAVLAGLGVTAPTPTSLTGKITGGSTHVKAG